MSKSRANEIDLLRFLAAISVVLYHYAFLGYAGQASPLPYPVLEPVAKYGHFGVELFFLISGFVILMSASSGSLKQFITSRIARLYPAFWACCSVTFLVIIIWGNGKPSATLAQYLSNMTMLSSFGFMQKIAAVPYIDGSYWSLAVEMRFYAMIAVILLFRKIHKSELFFTGWLIATVAVEALQLTRLRGILIVDYSTYFIAGAMFFQIWSRGFSALRLLVVAAAWALALYQAWMAVPAYEANFHTSINAFSVLAILSSFFIVMLLISTKRTGWIGRKNWVTVGTLTYPLYLIHQVTGYIIFNKFYPTVNAHVLLWSTLALMLGISYLVNTQIENRFAPLLKRTLTTCWDASLRLVQGTRNRAGTRDTDENEPVSTGSS
jgi:peptidoglycan/LPS O-acetylase OafA/YrhL